MRQYSLEQHPQHRDHGAHRRRQDHDDRAHPVLHREDAQDRRGPRRRGRHGLDGAGTGTRHHHHVRRDDRVLARHPDQHHRHARARGLHHGSRAQPARARRRHRAVLLRRGRRAAVRDRVAAGRQVRHPAHRLRQQDGPHRRGLLPRPRDDGRPPRGQPRGAADPHRPRGRVPRHHRPHRDERHRLPRRARHRLRDHRHPGRPQGARGRVPPQAGRVHRRPRRPPDGGVPRG